MKAQCNSKTTRNVLSACRILLQNWIKLKELCCADKDYSWIACSVFTGMSPKVLSQKTNCHNFLVFCSEFNYPAMEIAQATSLPQPALKGKSFGQCHGTVPGNIACTTGDGGEGSCAGRCPLGHTNPEASGFSLTQPGSVLLLRPGNDAGSTHSSQQGREFPGAPPLLWGIKVCPKRPKLHV